MLYFLVPNGKEIFVPISNGIHFSWTFIDSLQKTFLNLFSIENLKTWNFWIFLYISFCVASHMGLSKADRSGMWGGFFWVVLLIILINVIALLLGINITQYILRVNQYLGIFVAMFIYALLISSLHFVFSFLGRRLLRR